MLNTPHRALDWFSCDFPVRLNTILVALLVLHSIVCAIGAAIFGTIELARKFLRRDTFTFGRCAASVLIAPQSPFLSTTAA